MCEGKECDGSCKNNDVKAEGQEISSTGVVKLPEFWDKSPAAWFISIENIFRLRNVKADSKKYQHVLAALPQHVVLSVLDIIKEENDVSYEKLKAALIERNSLSEEQRLSTLFSQNNVGMGDRRPSEFLRYLENIADSGTGVNKELVLKLWMNRLPKEINVALLASNQKDSTALMSMADKIWDALHKDSIMSVRFPQQSTSTNEQTTKPSSDALTTLCTGISEICKELQAMRSEINELKGQQQRSRSSKRKFTPVRNQNRNRSLSSKRTYEFCWYHHKFGSRATKCNPPCKFNESDNSKN